MKRKLLTALLLSACSGILVTILFSAGILESLELKTLDFRFREFSRPERASKDIVLIMIDDKSIAEFHRNRTPWPWPRDFYAKLVQYLQQGKPRAIVFDVLFADNDIDRQSTMADETDGQFADAMSKAGNVILGVHIRNDQLFFGGDLDNSYDRQREVFLVPPSAKDRLSNSPTAVLPIERFQKAARDVGVVNYRDDPDGICRRLPLISLYRNHIFAQLGFSTYLASKDIDTVGLPRPDILRAADLEIPLDANGQFLISWYGKGGSEGCFTCLSFAAVLSSALSEEKHEAPVIPSSLFKDKYVFVGSNAAGLLDFKNTPFSSALEPYPATEIHATLLSNVLQHDFMVRGNPMVAICAVFALALVICFAFLFLPKIRFVILLSLVCAAGWLLAALFLFAQHHVWLDIVAPETAVFLSFLSAAVISYQTEGKARRHLRSVFGRYLSPAVITEVIDRSETVELGGKEITGTVLFSDIKDFTSISEQLSASELVVLLNEYFSLSTEIILTSEGLLDKYLGDSIMAIWGAPLATTDHARRACAAALEMQQLLKQQWASGTPDHPRLETRIGINTGPMVVGNIGSYRRLEYTAIGNTVNIASRLEGVNKMFKTGIIIGSTTFEGVKDEFVARKLDVLRVKGKKEAVAVFELMGKPEDVPAEVRDSLAKFESARRLYCDRAFDRALNAFQAILSVVPNDGASVEYIDRCRRFLQTPPRPDWDAIYTLDVK